MRVAIAGGSGLIGTELVGALRARGDEAVALPRFGSAPWSVEGADAVVNLAGASVAGKRWAAHHQPELETSRPFGRPALGGASPSPPPQPPRPAPPTAPASLGGASTATPRQWAWR